MNQTQGLSVPVGAVLPYAGQLNNNQLNALGWSICDGAPLSVRDYPQLFGALGTCNGGDGNTSFNLPDYRGYFLRGVDTTGAVDKGATSRTAAASGGASGAVVGSVEAYATGSPASPFMATVPHVPTDDHDAYSGSNADMLEPGGAQTFRSNGGGNSETRPLNAYVNFIIKIVADAGLPVGVVVPFAGASAAASINLLSWFRLCDGTLVSQMVYSALYGAIGSAHGGSGTEFNFPDYRGRFLRGVDSGVGRDPDAATRSAMAVGGNTGDVVGSIQGYATARPVNPFTISINLGTSDKESDHCAGHDNSEWNSGGVDVALTASGGDSETRPVNVGVDFYVMFQPDPNTADVFPIGAIIGFPGNTPPPSSAWLPCNGSSLSTKGQFAALFLAISTANGGDGEKSFNVPNYQGYFMRGTDHGQGRDPNAATRIAAAQGGAVGDNVGSQQGWATARPANGQDITATITHMPTSDADNAAAIWCSTVAEWDGAQVATVSGGDAETRPVNANINFYIKYAETTD